MAVLRQQVGFVRPRSVARHGHFDIATRTFDRFRSFPVTAVATVAPFGFVLLIAPLGRLLPFPHLFQGSGKQLGQDPFFAKKVIDAFGLT